MTLAITDLKRFIRRSSDKRDILSRSLAPVIETLESRRLMANIFGDNFTQQWTENFVGQTQLNTARWKATNDWNGTSINPTFNNGLQLTVSTNHTATYFPNQEVYTHETRLFGRYAGTFTSTGSIGLDQSHFLHKPDWAAFGGLWNEIDMEVYGIGNGANVPVNSFHWGQTVFDSRGASEFTNGYRDDSSIVLDGTTHTWTMDWTPGYVLWSLDGKPTYAAYNRSAQTGWTYGGQSSNNNYAINGVESMVMPQNWAFINGVTSFTQQGQQNTMTVKDATYSSLNMQSFSATQYSAASGFYAANDENGRTMDNVYASPGAYLRYDNISPTWRNIAIDLSSEVSNRTIQVRTGSPTGPIIATINMPNTGSWTNYTLATANLPARTQTQSIYLTMPGTDTGFGGRIYNVHFYGTQPTSGEIPFGDVPKAVPGRVNASDYDRGGSGVGYNAYSIYNDIPGSQYRSDAANLAASTDGDGGLQLVNIHAGNWYKYAVNVVNAGTYTASFRVNAGGTGSFHLEDNAGNNLTGPINVTSTGWAYTTLNATVRLPAGQQIVKLVEDTTGNFNIHWMEFALDNKVANSSFETGNLDNWTEWVPPVNGQANANSKDGNPDGNHTGSYHLTHYYNTPYDIQTLQVASNLPNGTYSLSAWVKSSGGFAQNYMYAWRYNNPSGGSFQSVAIPTSTSNWIQITIPNIVVTSGMMEIGFRTQDNIGYRWAYIDDVVLTRTA